MISSYTKFTMCFPTCSAVLEHLVASRVTCTMREDLQVEETHAPDLHQVNAIKRISKFMAHSYETPSYKKRLCSQSIRLSACI